jgi:hypothetical protein
VSTQPALTEAREMLINIIAARGRPDRYAALLSRCRTSAAQDLIFRLYGEIADWETKTKKRVRRRLARTGVVFTEALERLVGDLLRARAANNGTGRVFHALGKTTFDDVPVSYDVFIGLLDGLQGLGLLGVEKGHRKSGRTSAFWATDKLVQISDSFGVHLDSVGEHFKPEPPHSPLVLRGHGYRIGRRKIDGPIIRDYKRTEHTERLEADVRELNDFLACCDISGGEHYGFTRNFNNASWKKGGRQYSIGGGYQQLPEAQRLKMTINGEAVAEIDVKASHLTIYHAKLKCPLSRESDPYERVGADRAVAKLWTVASFGNSSPATRWPPDMAKKFQENTGKELRAVAKATDIGKKMLKAFPVLRRLKEFKGMDIWGDLQFIEAEAVINTMLILMREHRIPCLSTHDGIIVPRSGVRWTKAILTQQYRKFAGVEPVLTVDPEEADYVSALDL